MKRDSRLAPVLAIVGGAIVLVVALVVAMQLGHTSNKKSAANIATDSIAEMLSGIKQNGIELGNPKAKVTLVEFSDPQCPFCGEWARNTLPSLIQKYVRTGKLRIEYRGLDFLDQNFNTTDSERLLRLALAAGFQNKLWNVVELSFENQGQEGTGWATDKLVRGIAIAVGSKGFDASKALADANTNRVVPLINAAEKLGKAKIGKDISTPSFLIERTGSTKVEKTIVGAQPLSTFTKAIDAQLAK
ncbi:MAG TPA: thioredoxin domain-containing protein [Gaiellaceae bacterium]